MPPLLPDRFFLKLMPYYPLPRFRMPGYHLRILECEGCHEGGSGIPLCFCSLFPFPVSLLFWVSFAILSSSIPFLPLCPLFAFCPPFCLLSSFVILLSLVILSEAKNLLLNKQAPAACLFLQKQILRFAQDDKREVQDDKRRLMVAREGSWWQEEVQGGKRRFRVARGGSELPRGVSEVTRRRLSLPFLASRSFLAFCPFSGFRLSRAFCLS